MLAEGSPLSLPLGGTGLALRAGCTSSLSSGGGRLTALVAFSLEDFAKCASLFAANLRSADALASLSKVSIDGGGGLGAELCLAGGLTAGVANGVANCTCLLTASGVAFIFGA